MYDIYTYLFKSVKNFNIKTLVDFNDIQLFIKNKKSNNNVLIYEIYNHARIEYNLEHYYGYTTIFNAKKLDKVLKLIDIINKFNNINYNIIESKIEYYGVDLTTVYILNDIKIPFISHKYNFLQADIPYNDLELLKSNSYYYSQYVNQVKDDIIKMSMSKFIKFLKSLYGDKFEEKDYLKEIESLEKFKMRLPRFMKEKAKLPKQLLDNDNDNEVSENKECFDFFYLRMRLILEDLHIRPSHFIRFY